MKSKLLALCLASLVCIIGLNTIMPQNAHHQAIMPEIIAIIDASTTAQELFMNAEKNENIRNTGEKEFIKAIIRSTAATDLGNMTPYEYARNTGKKEIADMALFTYISSLLQKKDNPAEETEFINFISQPSFDANVVMEVFGNEFAPLSLLIKSEYPQSLEAAKILLEKGADKNIKLKTASFFFGDENKILSLQEIITEQKDNFISEIARLEENINSAPNDNIKKEYEEALKREQAKLNRLNQLETFLS